MPGLAQRNDHYSSWFWSEDVDGVGYNQLHKFWSELSLEARQELLKIDKQALFEQARSKNMCCSRCNGLLLEDFLQIVSYGRSTQEKESKVNLQCNISGASEDQIDCKICNGELQDPIVHQWGGLTTARDGSLTLLDSYLYAKSFKELQTVFESACARERERMLLYPYACGGRYRRRVCALHTMRLSCDTLVDFWSTLEDESRQSLMRMKEDDFMERLTYRFDRMKFCRDCRRNVIREFKGQQCVHSMLVVGDGYVSLKRCECIRMLLEHAQEVEKEEDKVMLDKDGNKIDGPQKHAKSPELAREFLQEAASVIFKEKVEKAYREGTSRENAHSLFVCLSSKLLEQRLHIACKEVVTLEKQEKLMEEEDKDKREEEERKERKRRKERVKKLRRKEKLKEKEQKNAKLGDLSREEEEEEGVASLNVEEETNNITSCKKSGTETGVVDLSSPDDDSGECMDGCISPTQCCDRTNIEIVNDEDENGWLTKDKPRPVVHQTARFCKEHQHDHNALRWSERRRYPVNASFVNRYPQSDYRPRSKVTISQSPSMMDQVNARKVLVSMELKHQLNSLNSDVSSITCSTFKAQEVEEVDSAVESDDTLSQCKPAETITMNIVDQAQTLEPLEQSSLKETYERKSNRVYPMETPSSRVRQSESAENFSLFHFGGPVAPSNGSKSYPAHSKDGIFGDFSSQFSGDHVFSDLNSNNKEKESTIGEEYNLFATSNIFSFTIF